MVLVVKDSMVLIHLAKISLLESSCDYFGKVIIPQAVFEETVDAGKSKGSEDAFLIEAVIGRGNIRVKKVLKKQFMEKANQLNIFGGEAEAVALYWQESAEFLATDDDNVRAKKDVLGAKLIGTPAIILALHKKKFIGSEKTKEALSRLRKIGWFSSEIIDRALMEVS
ncbi:MAG: hypothetical protein V1676_01770 [Candidatus Diapherotrites archaeon]